MMSAGQRANEQKNDAAGDPLARRLLELESDAVALRADNAALRAQLALRDHALDATPTFFVITRQETPAPIIVYCNKIVAEQHGLVREDLIGKPITLLSQVSGGSAGRIACRPDGALRRRSEPTRRQHLLVGRLHQAFIR
jgi:PAS domain-containing protein